MSAQTVFLLIAILFISINAQGILKVNPETNKIEDALGRERFFHGVNMVIKVPPYIPDTSGFHPGSSFVDKDMADLKEWGLNVVRLGSMWPGVEPEENIYNATYLNTLEEIVNNGEKFGIYTLLDFHQDLFSEKFCADGVPKWAVKEPDWSIFAFPRPVDLSAYTYDNITGNPIGCEKHAWASYYFSYAVASNFQYLYDNTYGLLDKLGNFWSILADRFKNNTNIIGYELINEPFAGNIFKNPLLLIPGYADSQNLQKAYDTLNEYIRKVDDQHLVFFEPVTWGNFISVGFSHVPGGEKYQNRSVLSHHYYKPPDLGVEEHFKARENDVKRLKSAAFLTEFWGSNGELLTQGNLTMDAVDEYLMPGWMGWAYKTFSADVSNNSDGVYNQDGTVRFEIARKLARTYAQAVAGRTKQMKFVENSGEFTLVFNICVECGETEIYYSEQFYYPNGLAFDSSPKGAINWTKSERNKIKITASEGTLSGTEITINMKPTA